MLLFIWELASMFIEEFFKKKNDFKKYFQGRRYLKGGRSLLCQLKVCFDISTKAWMNMII